MDEKNLKRDVEYGGPNGGLSLWRCHGGRIPGDLVRCPQPRSRRAPKGRESQEETQKKSAEGNLGSVHVIIGRLRRPSR